MTKNLSSDQNTNRIRWITQLALLFAVALVLMAVEGSIPPIPTLPPGVKLGLSNIVVMFCLFNKGKRQAFTILLLKCFFVLITRGVTAFVLSFSGGLLSISVMIALLLLKKCKLSFIIISMCASVSHNLAQLVISSILLSTAAVWYYSPVLIISGIFMGILTGTVLWVTIPAMKRINRFK